MEPDHKQLKRSFIIRWFFGVAVIMGVTAFFYINARQNIWEYHRSELLNVVKITASQIDGDAHAAMKGLPEDENTDVYRIIKKQLQEVRDAVDGIKFIYTMVKGDDPGKPNLWKFVVDAEENPQELSHSGDPYDITNFPLMAEAYSKAVVDNEIGYDQWGPFLSAYAPIKNRTGSVVGIVGVDRKGILISSDLNQVTYRTLGVALLFIIIFTFALFFYYRNRRYHLMKEEIRAKNEHIRKLEILLPICCVCKNIRDDEGTEKGKGSWKALEDYIHESYETNITHTICPKCKQEIYGDVMSS